eukprot:6177862-Pleurochrysis_carterae.AAC.1
MIQVRARGTAQKRERAFACKKGRVCEGARVRGWRARAFTSSCRHASDAWLQCGARWCAAAVSRPKAWRRRLHLYAAARARQKAHESAAGWREKAGKSRGKAGKRREKAGGGALAWRKKAHAS